MQAKKEKIYPAPFPVWKKRGANDLQKRCWVNFIGIGGIGTSALAQYFLKRGYLVYGSDLISSEIIKNLKKMGAKIFIGKHKAQNLPAGVRMVIYSPAVQKDNPELKKAKKLKIKCRSYPEALGEFTKKYWTIAVSGTHGKSTTAAMIALILIKSGLDPTVILGTRLKEFKNSNFRFGKSKYLVIEADEWQASFLNYWPKIIVLTNIEKEHLDYYKNLRHILKTYREYIRHLPKGGVLVVNRDDRNIKRLLNPKSSPSTFLFQKGAGQEIQMSNKIFTPLDSFTSNGARNLNVKKFSIKDKETKKLKKILKIPGEHNVKNALAALTVARVLGIPDKISFEVLSEYRGSWRRFDVKTISLKLRGEKGERGKRPITVINDYAHHPTEISATLKAAREKYPRKEIWCIFQPHQYQRTFYLFKDFVKVFKNAPVDKLIITDIYDVAGREKKGIKKKVNSQKLVKEIARPLDCLCLAKEKIIDYLKRNLEDDEVVILMGAGDIYDLNLKFRKQ